MRGYERFAKPSWDWTEVPPPDSNQGQDIRHNPHKIQLFLHPRFASTHPGPFFGLGVGEETREVDTDVRVGWKCLGNS